MFYFERPHQLTYVICSDLLPNILSTILSDTYSDIESDDLFHARSITHTYIYMYVYIYSVCRYPSVSWLKLYIYTCWSIFCWLNPFSLPFSHTSNASAPCRNLRSGGQRLALGCLGPRTRCWRWRLNEVMGKCRSSPTDWIYYGTYLCKYIPTYVFTIVDVPIIDHHQPPETYSKNGSCTDQSNSLFL